MSFIRQYIHRPQQLWLRKVMFQVHFWLGIILGVYIFAVGLTGSILVFKEEAVASLVPKVVDVNSTVGPQVSVDDVLARLRSRYPKDRLALIGFPNETTREFQTVAMRAAPGGGSKIMIASHPVTGEIVGDVNLTDSWLGFTHNLHIVLLAGPKGFIANGIGAALLLVITASGLFLWWPGIRAWQRAFTVQFRNSWRRINYDLHNTIGFYTLAIVSFWSVSTVYFVWEEPVTAALNRITPVTRPHGRQPVVQVPPRPPRTPRVPIAPLTVDALARVPGTRLHSINPGLMPKQPVTIYLIKEGDHEDAAEMPSDATRVFFDPFTGQHLATRRPHVNQTVGDWIVWSMAPLHFGNQWGLVVKIIWATLGLSLPLLTVTGFLMWWNRSLRKKFKHAGQARADQVAVASVPR